MRHHETEAPPDSRAEDPLDGLRGSHSAGLERLENRQREDGSVDLPAPLQEFGIPERIPTE